MKASLILAGAGTGKTTAIVNKVKQIIQEGQHPANKIVCLTFSNEAARSMEARISSVLDKKPIVRTFHGFCSDILKQYANKAGIKEDFRILLPEDAMIMLHKNLKVPPQRCYEYVYGITNAKDLGITIQELELFLDNERKTLPENPESELEKMQFQLNTLHAQKADKDQKHHIQAKIEYLSTYVKREKFLKAWKNYEKLKAKKNSLDYADLVFLTLKLVQENPEIANNWECFIVDEFQDTNKVQLDFLKAIAPHKNITAVGDMNQSIYRFRGAYKNNLDLFIEYFSINPEEIENLSKSYRSPNTVLRTANKIISNNDGVFAKINITNAHEREGEKIQAFELKNSKEEVRKILEIINKELEERKPEEICVMFRTHHQASLLKKSLDQQGIPYQSVTKRSLLKQPYVKKIIDYLTIINSLDKKRAGNSSCWWELISDLGINDDDAIIIGSFLRKNREHACISELLLEELTKLPVSSETQTKLQALIAKINLLLNSTNKNVDEIISEITKTFSLTDLENTKQGREAILALERFNEIIAEQKNIEFFDLDSFIYHINIIRTLNVEIECPISESEGLRIMTAHSTKGLEYPVVIIANMAQKKFPIEKTTLNTLIPLELMPDVSQEIKNIPKELREEYLIEHEKENQLRDERRLCYVAFTRAKENLYITYAKDYGGRNHQMSQFLYEAQHTENPDIDFQIDNQELYQQPELEIKTHEKPQKTLYFSPSALRLFTECQKRYEYKYVFNMPEEEPPSWEAIKLGSFVHLIMERGVKANFKNEQSFIEIANEEALKPEWESLQLPDALFLLKVFFERNKNKYNQQSKTEEKLNIKLDGINFTGIADRIDFHPDGLEIIDYKTGQYSINPRERNWQLGLYALAAANKYNQPVKRVTLDMLKQEKPLEFDIKDKIALERINRRMSFNLEQVQQELVDTAKSILACYKSGFQPCPIDKNCDFCTDKVWKV